MMQPAAASTWQRNQQHGCSEAGGRTCRLWLRAARPWPCPRLPCSEVFSWGINDFGMLGNGTTSYATEPERVEGLEGVTIADVAAGGWHSMAISTEGGESRLWRADRRQQN